MKQGLIIGALFCFFIMGCTPSQKCTDGINKLPLFGGVKKCREQLENDQQFIADCDKTFKSRKEAEAHMLMRGWQYFHSRNLDTATMRFNQAWLLDSLNAEVYWGLGNISGEKENYTESIGFFKRSLKIDPANSQVWHDLSTSYGNMFLGTKNMQYLNLSVNSLKKAISLDPHNAKLYGELTSSYCYFAQKDSANKYLEITNRLDPNAVNPAARKILNK